MTTPNADPQQETDAALSELRAVRTPSLVDLLGIEVIELTRDRVVLTMPVDERTRQPFGILHGGASVALIESAVSLGAWRNVDRAREAAVGLEINANHLRAKRDGVVRCVATPVHRGRSTQVWTATITDEQDRPICIGRCTLAVVPLR
jgi:1,4-dihydroxy-2-naphthoyl-CoA hydrolase